MSRHGQPGKGHRSPKRFVTPRTVGWRDEGNISSSVVLQDAYPLRWTDELGREWEERRPDWARDARDRRWMTWVAYWDTPTEECRRREVP